jgi:chaperonin cofactor prefoldin
MTDSELQAEYDRLNDQKKAINDQIKAIKAELRVRFETNDTGPKPPLSTDPSSKI